MVLRLRGGTKEYDRTQYIVIPSHHHHHHIVDSSYQTIAFSLLHAFEILQANLLVAASLPFGYDQEQYHVPEARSAHDVDEFNDHCDQLQSAISACKEHIVDSREGDPTDQLQRGHLNAESVHNESQWKDACRAVKRNQ
eukprot:2785133-Karenia_brevis.AAC.1